MSLKALKQQFFKMMLDAPESSSSTPSTTARKVSKHFEIFSLSDSKLVPFKTQIRDFSWFYVIFVERPREQNIVVDCLTELFLLPEVHLQFYIFLILKTTQLHRLSVSLFLVIGGFTKLMSSIIQRNLPQIGESDWLSHSRLFPLSINRAALQKTCWRTEG